MTNHPSSTNVTGLLLTGGGARAAYQVGVLEAIADIRKSAGAQNHPNPFPIITGTSAGAINASALACGADDFDEAVRGIVEVWKNFRAYQVYRADSLSMLRSGASWMTLRLPAPRPLDSKIGALATRAASWSRHSAGRRGRAR